ncbi:MAG: biotin/lipoyl-binding protein, partial [Parasporobacterium sp.]|nr:biotin/lipoyl-binding protein [Parasporobacterium sp.]
MKNKKLLIIIIVAVVIAAAVAVLVFRPFEDKSVNVYPVSQVASQEEEYYTSELSGTIREEGFQSIYISETQTVSEVYVEMGQHVEPGDALFSYDTTLSDLELEKAANDVQKTKVDLQRAQQELQRINNLVPSTEVLIEPDNSWIHYDPVTTPYLLAGTGTKKDPIYYIIDSSDEFDTEFFKKVVPEGKKKSYLVFLIRENNAVNGKIEESFGFEVSIKKDQLTFKPFVPDIPDSISHYDEPEEPYYEQRGSEYTAGEIAAMRLEAESDVRELTLQVQLAELEYEKKTKEVSDNVVRAKTAGTVKMVRPVDNAASKNEPLIRISSGGGYYVDVQLNELSLDSMKVGDTVNVSS